MSIQRKHVIVSLLLVLVCAASIVLLRDRQRIQTVVIYNLVSYPILDASVVGIKRALIEEGYGPDRLRIQELNANGEMDKLYALATEVVNSHPDVIVPVSTPVTKAVIKAAASQYDVVFSTVTNPKDADIRGRIQPPRVTGVSDAVNYEACIALVLELFPRTKRIGMIYNAGEENSRFGVEEVRRLAAEKHFELVLTTVASSGEVENAARALVERIDAIYVGSDNTVAAGVSAVLKVANENKIPVFASDAGTVEQGALAAVSVDYEAVGRQAGRLVAEILKSGKPAGLIPNVVFRGDSLVLNQVAAGRLGYAFPEPLIRRASRVVSK